MLTVIDRFEGEYAVVVLQDEKTVNLPRILVPGAKEGDVVRIEVDAAQTQSRKEAVQELMNNLFEDA